MNKPISVEEADKLITTALYSPVSEACDLSEATNRVLAEDITADRDFPPFHRVAMDGIAIRYDDFHNGCRTFTIQGVQPAGNPPQILEERYTCVEVMTGAVLPIGADTVIRYEDLNRVDDQFDIVVEDIRPKQNVHHQGTDQKIGDILLPAGKYISPADVGILATVGKHQVQVHSLPKIAIISTGDELVDVSETPMPHQIRKSNVHVLSSFLRQLGMTADSFHLNDELNSIRNQLPGLIADYDVLLLSGAVSKENLITCRMCCWRMESDLNFTASNNALVSRSGLVGMITPRFLLFREIRFPPPCVPFDISSPGLSSRWVYPHNPFRLNWEAMYTSNRLSPTSYR